MAKTRAQEGACTMAEPEDTGPGGQQQAKNIVNLRDAAISAALHRYAHALFMASGREQTRARFAALMALADARCMGVRR